MKHIVALIILIVLLGCQTQQTAFEPIKIGAVFHLTGVGSFWGTGEHNAAQLAVEEINTAGGINGRPLELIVEDTKTDFPQTSSAFMKLIEIDKVPVIVGPTWFGQVAAPIAEQSRVTILSPSTGPTVPREKYFFNLWHTELQEVSPIVAFMAGQGIKKVATMYSQNDWSAQMEQNFVDEAKKQGIAIVKQFATGPDETDFRTVVAELKTLDIDAVYAPIAFYPSQGAFSKQAKELKLNVPLYSSSNTENPVLLEAYPEIEGTTYTYPAQNAAEVAFAQRYQERFSMPASPSAAYAYDAVNLIAGALRTGATTSDEIATYLDNVKDYAGISNTITFENGRVTQKEHVVKAVKNELFVPLQ